MLLLRQTTVRMKASLAAIAFFLLVLISVAESTPVEHVEEEADFDFGVFQPPVADHGDRHRRVTCDLLSFTSKWISFGHAACAAHCLAMFRGYKGGHCDENGICNCRK